MLYILLAGGVFNAVLVPAAGARDEERPGRRRRPTPTAIITLAGLFLAVVTAILVVAAPLLMRLFLDPEFFTPELAAQRESVIAFARYCLPQVFFYGMFVLVGQVLNSRGRFGPMMWAPIANNVVSVAVLDDLPAITACGRRRASPAPRRLGGFTAGPRRCSGSARRSASSSSCWCCCPTCAGRRLPLPAALRLPRHRARAHPAARRLDGAVRGGQPGRLHGRGADRQQRHRAAPTGACDRRGATGYTDLLQLVPADDGPALDHHGLAGHGDAAAALVVRRRPGDLAAVGRRSRLTLRSAYALSCRSRCCFAVMALDIAHVIWGYGSARRRLRQLRARRCAVRPRPGAVHRALPGAARLLRPRAARGGCS